ncbi:MAG TPA: tripartite tricarboxylate transporter substrate-binding protein, partial [Halothiobacillus sp.]|nr:tripartite tricarboxylate transporter substrate-binding protein [Halothiobacillus sp.]
TELGYPQMGDGGWFGLVAPAGTPKPIIDKLNAAAHKVMASPDYLEKHTTAPRDEVMIIQDAVLTYTRQGQTYTLHLAEHPEATAYANSMRGLLTGNAAILKQSYALELSGDPAHWTLLLLPTDTRIASLIKNISVTGAGDSVQMIEYDQTNGDRSVMTIRPASPSAP